MSDIWNRVQQLEGKTLHTRKQGKRFKVVGVLADRVQFIPESGTGTLRWCARAGIEQIAELNLKPEALTASRIQQEWPSDYNGSYVAAIVYTAMYGSDAKE